MKRFNVKRVDLSVLLKPGQGQALKPEMTGFRWRVECPYCPAPGHTYSPSWEWAWANLKVHLKRHAAEITAAQITEERERQLVQSVARGYENYRAGRVADLVAASVTDGVTMESDEDEVLQFRNPIHVESV